MLQMQIVVITMIATTLGKVSLTTDLLKERKKAEKNLMAGKKTDE